jgi:hypothetical protein
LLASLSALPSYFTFSADELTYSVYSEDSSIIGEYEIYFIVTGNDMDATSSFVSWVLTVSSAQSDYEVEANTAPTFDEELKT